MQDNAIDVEGFLSHSSPTVQPHTFRISFSNHSATVAIPNVGQADGPEKQPSLLNTLSGRASGVRCRSRAVACFVPSFARDELDVHVTRLLAGYSSQEGSK